MSNGPNSREVAVTPGSWGGRGPPSGLDGAFVPLWPRSSSAAWGCLFAAVANPYKVKPTVSGAMWVSGSGAGTGGSVRLQGLGFGTGFKGPLSCFGYTCVNLETTECHQMGAPKRRPQREAAPEREAPREEPPRWEPPELSPLKKRSQRGAPRIEAPKEEPPKKKPQRGNLKGEPPEVESPKEVPSKKEPSKEESAKVE